MARVEKIIPNLYRDSVALMQLSGRIANRPGIERATAVMATEANIALLKEAALLDREIAAQPNDLLIIIEGAEADAANDAMQEIESALQQTRDSSAATPGIAAIAPSSIEMALEDMPDADFALISTPGEYAAAEAEKALRLGLNVMLFSANVEIDDEIALKERARANDLLMMGPDCGTAIVNGIPLGFANVVRRGPVGLVASAGTGLQEVTTLIDRAGIGISQALGCGGRDLSEEVGGISMLQGLSALAGDASTQMIVLVAKHPSMNIAHRIGEAAARAGKPIVINFLGINMERPPGSDVYVAETLEDAAQLAVALARGERPSQTRKRRSAALTRLARKEASRLNAQQKYIRGLFSGGTFCYEAQMLLSEAVGTVWSNTPINPDNALSDIWLSREHTLIDLGDDVFTRGRPHPMIDQRLRIDRIAQEFNDPETAVILLDVVLGYGAHPDPGSALAETIAKLRGGGNGATFVASVCGTEGDPQNLTKQETALQEAGVILAPSNAAAARLAADIVTARNTAEKA